jgi:hypothetical protein
MFASAVRAIQRLPVQGNLLDKNKTPIEDANLPSNRGMLITEVKGHYLNLRKSRARQQACQPNE